MINIQGKNRTTIQKDTRVLFRYKSGQEYLMTNEAGNEPELLRVFTADTNGKILMEGLLLGSIFAHDPYTIQELEEINCTFEELNPSYFDRDPVVDGLIGLATGDAFGVPVEFLSRDTVRKIDLQDMVGNDTPLVIPSRWGELIPSGSWSDDTSMTIAAMYSIIIHHGEIDYDDIMRQFLSWWDNGEYSSLAYPFGLGTNISNALARFRKGTPALACGGKEMMDNGNGALMRIFPFSMYCIMNNLGEEETLTIIRQAAGITHGHEINAMSCYLYTLFLDECLRTHNPDFAYRYAINTNTSRFADIFSAEAFHAHELLFSQLISRSFDPDGIPESGYVVDSLAIAIYSLLHTDNYRDAVRMAVNFGYDTDTNAAITGSIAGAMYGRHQIPDEWLKALKKKDQLLTIGRLFSRRANRQFQIKK